jgi:hypothetical protein
MDEEELKKMREADAVASGLFGGAAFRPVGETLSNVRRAITSAQTPAMMAGSAGVNPLTATNVPAFPSRLGPLVRTDYGLPPSERPEYRDPALQWDARQTRTASTPIPLPTMPSAVSVGQNLVTQQPIRNPVLPANLTQNRVIPDRPSYNQIQTPYGMVFASTEAPKEGGPSQASNQRVMEMGYLPEQSARLANIGEQAQRNAAIAQMRERGAALGQQGIQRQEQFFTQKRAERDALRLAESEARAGGISSMDIMRARGGGPSTMAGIRSDFQNYQPQIGPMAPTSTLVANAVSGFNRGLPSGGSRPLPSGPLGPSGYALAEQERMARGSSNPYSNVRAEQRRRTRDISRSQGLQPAYSRQIQEEQEDYFRRMGLM